MLSLEILTILKYHTFQKKTLVLCIICIICSKCENGDEKIFKEEESILKILELIKTIWLIQKYDWRKHKPKNLD